MSGFQTKRPSIRHSETGMIAIMTTMVLMIVISLIVIGFAQITRRNQRQSLDKQLSAQAFYAAESGVNDARELIKNAVAAGNPVVDKTDCTASGPYASLNTTIDIRGVSYSCLLVDASPLSLQYSDVGTTSTVIPMTSASGSPFSTINLSWQSKIVGNPLTGCPTVTATIPATSSWSCGYGMLRFDLVPTSGNFNADSLRSATMTTFAVPFSSGGSASIPYAASNANTNNIRGVQCTATKCNLSITGLSQNSYYMRVSSLYRNVSLEITATGPSGPVELVGSQAVIDVTGKAQDVLRRIQVHVPLRSTTQNELSDFAIQSTDAICKRFAVMDGYFRTMYVSGVTSTNRLCQP